MPTSEGASVVASQEECQDFCTATVGCNAASFYNTLVGGNNCWLKTLANSCELPADAPANPNATLLLKQEAACALQLPAPRN